ncbi:MAG: YggS family pyridoxal phosphate-dependent enzyme [Planctomycetota bacterium]
MTALAASFAAVHERLAAACRNVGRSPDAVALLAVSKRHPAEAVREALALGQRDFGENRVQELVQKSRELADVSPAQLRWHLIGSLQTNKVRDLLAVPGLAVVQSLDRLRLADELQRECARLGRSLDVLLQVNATGEQQKHGCAVADAPALLAHVQATCPALRVDGLMAMGPLDGDPRPVFDEVVALQGRLRSASGLPLSTTSIGMSDDLEVAVAAGSTMVRIGTALFGERQPFGD